MLKKIFEDIRKKGSFSFEKIIENYTMSDDEFFEFNFNLTHKGLFEFLR